MGFMKHGVGEVLPDDNEQQHTASKQDWDGQDEQALAEENED